MKVTYTFANGETKEIEVDETTGELIKDLDRQERNNNKKETRRHYSIEYATTLYGIEPADKSVNLEQDIIYGEDLKHLHKALDTLTTDQKDLVRRVFFNREQLKDIALKFGVSYQAIQDRLNKILKKLRKNF